MQYNLLPPDVAFQQPKASFEHQSLSLLVLCMKYHDSDLMSLTCLYMCLSALAPFGFFNSMNFQKRVYSRDVNNQNIVKCRNYETSRIETSLCSVNFQKGLNFYGYEF
ncbi:hypothetical protein KIL84_003447 [Mauremys mutica]|uniref:Uncharacterized protein n=1 Tax=Mauremys mutica TaxID=74926 RepID=A0A9D3WPG3_9SAUR|nr:hypothetical protein KIL84_003447 [Mauremys mutica]